MSLKYLNLSGLEDLWINIKNYILSKVPTKTSELTNDSGYLTSHQSLANYVDLSTTQTITAIKVITGGNQGKMLFKNPNYTKGDAVESGTTISRLYFGNGTSYATANGVLTTDINSAGNTSMELCAMNNTASNSNRASLIITYDKSATSPRLLKSWGNFVPYSSDNYTLGNSSSIWKECYCNAYYLGTTAFGDIVTHNASEFLTDHPSITLSTNTTSTASPAHGGTFTCIDSVTQDTNGHITKVNTKTVTLPADSNTDTLVAQNYSTTNNTYPLLISSVAGISSTSNRGNKASVVNNGIYANPSTGSIYATKVYSGGSEVLTSHQSLTDYVKFTDCTSDLMTAVWGKVLRVDASSGLTEIGKYIDFHAIADDTIDYAVRLEAVNASSPANGNGSLRISATSGVLPSANNKVPLGNTSLRWSGVYTQALYSYGDVVLQGNYNLRNSADNGYTRVQGGSAEGNGGRLVLSGKTRSVNAGYCELIATDGTNTNTLAIRPDGTASVTGTLTATGFTGPLTGNVTGNCSGSSGSCTGNAATATQFSANKSVTLTGDVTGTASSKAGWSVATTLANSGVTAGTYGPSEDVTGNNNTTISVPQITVDAKGRVTSVTNRTYTSVNTDSNTDTKVTQTVTTANSGYPVLLCATANATATGTTTSRFSAGLTVNTRYSSIYMSNKYDTANTKGVRNTASYSNGILYFRSYDDTQMGLIRCDSHKSGYQHIYMQASNYIKNGAINPEGTATTCSIAVRVRDNGSKTIYTEGSWENSLTPYANNTHSLGTSSLQWKNTYTKKINNLEPGSLSLPNPSNSIDISAYFTYTGTGKTNVYTVPSNGWIFLYLATISSCEAKVLDAAQNVLWGTSVYSFRAMLMIPVVTGSTLQTQWTTEYSTVTVLTAKFYPCQGNV